jgi:D-arabinose 1-dehydrogenase-like Zn-dependent alcohol dehydrogenase
MHAAVVEMFGKPLAFREVPVPTPGPGQILVKTEACGVCHTDLHAASGDWPLKPALPFTPGHEGIGIVTALGSGVTAVPNILAMELAGFGPTSLYAGSWSEWCRTPGLPCAKG